LLDDEAWTRGARGDSPVGRVRIADAAAEVARPGSTLLRDGRVGTGLV